MDTKKLRQKILDLAIRGKLVPQDPNDEPASVLLERIRAEKERLIKEGKIKRSKKTASDMPNNEDEMFEVPKGWCWCYIDDLCDVVRGGSPRPAGSKEFYDGDIPFLKVADLTRDNFMYVTYAQNSIKEAGLVKTRQIEVNTLLLTNSGATLGVPKINTFPATINDGIAAFLYLPQELQYYMYWFLKANTGRFRGFNQGAAQPNLNTDIIKNVRVPLPPVNEQKRIVNEIDRWYAELEVMESNEGDLLKEINLAKSKILDLAIHGKLVSQDPNDEPAIELLKRISEDKNQLVKEGKLKKKDLEEIPISEGEIPFMIPKSWEWCRLRYFVQFVNGDRGKNYPSKNMLHEKGEIPFISAVNIGDNSISNDNLLYLSQKQYEALSQGKLHNNDIVLCIRGSLGKSAIYPFEKGAIASSLVILRNIGEICNKYLFYFMKTLLFFNQINSNDNGTAQPNLSADNVANFLIPIPPKEEQLRIVVKIEELFAVLDGIKESLE